MIVGPSQLMFRGISYKEKYIVGMASRHIGVDIEKCHAETMNLSNYH